VEFAVSFTEILPDPSSVKQIAWGWLLLALPAWAMAIFSLWVLSFSSFMDVHGELSGSVVFYFVLTVACWMAAPYVLAMGIFKTMNVTVFKTARGNVVIRNKRPTPQASREFVKLLQQRVADARDIQKRIAREILLIMHHDGLIDDWNYKKACERFGIKPDSL
jgi:hypothetical protein